MNTQAKKEVTAPVTVPATTTGTNPWTQEWDKSMDRIEADLMLSNQHTAEFVGELGVATVRTYDGLIVGATVIVREYNDTIEDLRSGSSKSAFGKLFNEEQPAS